MNYQIIQQLADGKFHSLRNLSRRLALSPETIRSRFEQLAAYGLQVQEVPGKGFRLAHSLELLEHQRVLAALGETQQKLPGLLEIFSVIRSTNQYLLDQGCAGGNAACLAEYQTAGRGRQGRQWHSPYASGLCLSLKRLYTIRPSPALNLALAVTVMRVVQELGGRETGIKWPNDIVWHNDHKLAGLLLEMRACSDDHLAVVAGLGLNLYLPAGLPHRTDQPWTDLNRVLGRRVPRNWLAGCLLSKLMETLLEYPEQGFSSFVHDWMRFDVLYGKPVTLAIQKGRITGIARGVDAQGALLLETKAGVQPYVSGEAKVIMNYKL
ncbi:MAG: biotin--[acetyl-CoA-carboxylase] ligase [Gammaproteobacteria bacterium]|nr:biotin--[acetyl-CoA-carboxylase] ligase [Gammaproteobacteria bacterium]